MVIHWRGKLNPNCLYTVNNLGRRYYTALHDDRAVLFIIDRLASPHRGQTPLMRVLVGPHRGDTIMPNEDEVDVVPRRL